jgi:hypothetical protein
MKKAIFLSVCFSLVSPCAAEIIIVDPNGSADFDNIQDAVYYAWDGDVVEVRPGTYDEHITFAGKAITVTGTAPDDPDVVAATVISDSGLYPDTRTVVFEWSEDSNSVLTGFTIKDGGIGCYGTSPTITKNVIMDCFAENENGGAIYGVGNACPTISYNIIKNNRVYAAQVGLQVSFGGGAISGCHGSIHHNIIMGNYVKAISLAGELSIDLKLAARGGGIHDCTGPIVNNVIAGNGVESIAIIGYDIPNTCVSLGVGGGLSDCNGVVKNNIIAHNSALEGGGIYGQCQNSYNTFFNNSAFTFAGGASPGIGDVSQNPFFVDEGTWGQWSTWTSEDLHLKSGAGRWDPNTQTWVNDDVNSPCIDDGDPCDPIGFEPNPNGAKINVGAYGGTAEASKSPSGIVRPVCAEYLPTDFNRDCRIDFRDLAVFALTWLECNLDPRDTCWQ